MARLTAAKRHSIPAKDFAGSAAKESYPIDTKKRARVALGLVGMHGSSALKAKVRAKVHAKYPDIGKQKKHGGQVDGHRPRHRMDRAAH
jgi:hypothetical protein